MDGWIDGWMNGWMDGWMDGLIDPSFVGWWFVGCLAGWFVCLCFVQGSFMNETLRAAMIHKKRHLLADVISCSLRC